MVPRRLEGTVGICDVTGDYYDVLLGLDNSVAMHGHHADFGLAWYASDRETPIGFVDDGYHQTYGGDRRDFRMSTTFTASTGYSGMQLHSVIQEFWDAITDAELRRRIVACPKMVDDGVFTAPNVFNPKDIRVLADVIWMPAAHEIWYAGQNSYAPITEASVTSTYHIFSGSSSRVAYAFDNRTKAVYWWTRSRSMKNAYFCTVTPTGGTDHACQSGLAVRPCYTIA